MNYRTRLEVYMEQRNVLGYLDYSDNYTKYLTPRQRRRLRKKYRKATCS